MHYIEKKEKKTKDKKESVSAVPQVNINVVMPNTNPNTNDKDTSELKKIKSSIKDNCSFNVNELKELLKSRGIKGISALSKQELIDKCMELKLLNTVLVASTPIEPNSKKRKTESSGGGRAAAAAPQVPNEFECPILFEMMTDPVLASDGFSYERSAIESWLRTHDTSPKTNATLAHKNLISNLTLKALINDFRHKHGI